MLEQTGAQAIGNIVPVAAPYRHGMISYLKSKCDYVRNLSTNFDELKTEEIRLCAIEEYVKNEKMRNPTMEMTRQCSRWLTEVQTMKGQIQDLRNRYDNTSRRLCGFYPFRSLLKLGKDIVTMTDEVILLREEEKKITKMVPRPPVSVIKKHPMKIADMPSLDEHVKRLIMYLKNDKLKTIGVFGRPGMGKTMVMEHLNDRVGELFEIVFYVTLPVPEMEIVETIQKIILEQLNLPVQGHLSSSMMADIISEALANKKYLLLLDQVSSKINLKEVGVHVDNHNHGRVVFACRDRRLCECMDEEIEIKGLSEVDAKKLFRQIVGDIIDQRKYNVIGRRLLNICSGVPHLIKLIAVRLRNVEDYGTWKSVLNRMQTPSKIILQEVEEFYKAVELIYESLSMDRQSCLLHWAIFPPDSELYEDYLIECWIGERLIAKNANKKLGHAREEGHEIMTEFERKYLVERGRKARHFKMPQIVQHMALVLRENNLKFLVAKREIEEQPSEEKWKDVERVSLNRQISFTLPDTPACSEISTLLLQKNLSLTNIPYFFFNSMPQLCVLDMCGTRITSLPPSISSLINLRVLYLNSCDQLVELPSELGNLKSLEILDLRGTGILSLPKVLAQMTGLKCLRVSFMEQNFGCTNRINGQRPEMIPPGVIESLSSLQELSIDVDFKNQIWNKIVYRVAEEVATLNELTSLCFYFPTLVCFQTFIQNCMLRRRGCNYLKSFRIQVGNHKEENFLQFKFFGYTDERHLRISGGEVISVEVSKLFNPVTTLELFGHDSENLSIFSAEELNLVEACTIKECNEMESIIDGNITTGVAFELLLNLHLINLPKLVSICKGSIDPTSLNRLKTMTLKSCPNLKSLFPEKMIWPLCRLQDLKVEDCSELKELIEVGRTVQAFPKLENMELSNLPKLVSICNGSIGSTSLDSLTTLTLKSCPKLNCLFPEYMIQSLCNLQDLKIEDCSELQEVIEVGSLVQTGAFSKLKNMELVNLPELFRLCEDNSLEWLSFEIMKIMTCPQLKELPFSKENAPSLRMIECTSQWWSNLNDSVKDRLEGLQSFA